MSIADESAFPFQVSAGLGRFHSWTGLTKRELIAVMALQGISSTMSNDLQVEAINLAGKKLGITPQKVIAQMAVAQADALIAELGKGK